jgi:Zn-finger nucleic acid-binding protein
MRVVSLNMDLADLLAVSRAVDAYLEQCPCGEVNADTLCEQCRSLEVTRGELSRLVRAPKLRPPASPRHRPGRRCQPMESASPSLGVTRPLLRVVSGAKAGG